MPTSEPSHSRDALNHGQSHNHGHARHRVHSHDHRESERIGFAFWLNFTFTIIEIVGGVLTNSVAILSNAIHDFGDTLAIGFGWLASRLAKRNPDDSYTYGYRRLSLLSALGIGLTLGIGSVIIIANAAARLLEPQTPHVGGMFWLSIIGIAANGIAAIRLLGGHTQNEKILSWHLLEDVLGWVAILIASIAIRYTGWSIIDPLLSIVFTLFILWNVVRNLRATLRLFLQKAPDVELMEQVKARLRELDGVKALHHLHLWSLDGEHHVLTAHIELTQCLNAAEQMALKRKIHDTLEPHRLAHTTIEFEFPDEICRDH